MAITTRKGCLVGLFSIFAGACAEVGVDATLVDGQPVFKFETCSDSDADTPISSIIISENVKTRSEQDRVVCRLSDDLLPHTPPINQQWEYGNLPQGYTSDICEPSLQNDVLYEIRVASGHHIGRTATFELNSNSVVQYNGRCEGVFLRLWHMLVAPGS